MSAYWLYTYVETNSTMALAECYWVTLLAMVYPSSNSDFSQTEKEKRKKCS